MNIIVKIILLIAGICLLFLLLVFSAYSSLYAVEGAILCGSLEGLQQINCNGCEDFWTSGS